MLDRLTWRQRVHRLFVKVLKRLAGNGVIWRNQRSSRKLSCLSVLAGALACVASPSLAQTPVLSIDKVFARPSGWLVGENDLGGCLAAGNYKDGTIVWIGFDRSGRSVLAFTNENWGSIAPGQSYQLQMRARGKSWRGEFTGFQRRKANGLVARGLKPQVLQDLATSGGISLNIGEGEMTRLSLNGADAALDSAIECQKQQIASKGKPPADAQAREAPEPQRKADGSSGTGFFVSRDGHVMTNHHVVKACRTFEVRFAGGAKAPANLVASDAANDLALLRTNLRASALPAFTTRPRIGESVYAFGFPLVGMLSTSGNFTIGNVTATAGLRDDARHLQVSTPVQVGNSGGPLLDQFGNVAGVIVSKLNVVAAARVTGDMIQNVNFAIKSSVALGFLESNGLKAADASKSQALDPATIAEGAKEFTVLVTCR